MLKKRNEYITETGLNWMSSGTRQYDPQLGRFLSVDPMASAGGQESSSSYENIVKRSINIALSQNEFDALVIMGYNHGKVYDDVATAINHRSTMNELRPLWLSHDLERNAHGKMVEWRCLENRRVDEFELYNIGDYIRNH